jgi:hypothetical protein
MPDDGNKPVIGKNPDDARAGVLATMYAWC